MTRHPAAGYAFNPSESARDLEIQTSIDWGGPTLFLSVDFVNILPKTGGGQTFMFTKALKILRS